MYVSMHVCMYVYLYVYLLLRAPLQRYPFQFLPLLEFFSKTWLIAFVTGHSPLCHQWPFWHASLAVLSYLWMTH